VETASYAVTVAGVRAVIAAYAQAVDDGRHGDIAALSCADGSVDLPAAGVVVGRDGGWRFHSRTLRFVDDP
jgi:SnoaL-like domain